MCSRSWSASFGRAQISSPCRTGRPPRTAGRSTAPGPPRSERRGRCRARRGAGTDSVSAGRRGCPPVQSTPGKSTGTGPPGAASPGSGPRRRPPLPSPFPGTPAPQWRSASPAPGAAARSSPLRPAPSASLCRLENGR